MGGRRSPGVNIKSSPTEKNRSSGTTKESNIPDFLFAPR